MRHVRNVAGAVIDRELGLRQQRHEPVHDGPEDRRTLVPAVISTGPS